MEFGSNEAVHLMNEWGGQKIPFLFVIDYEMKKVLLYKIDRDLPDNIAFSFPFKKANTIDHDVIRKYTFRKFPVSFDEYDEAFQSVKSHIFKGNSFLLNLTFPSLIETDLSLREIFDYSNATYKLWLDEKFVVFSPETFIQISNGVISSKPMKGTIRASEPNALQKILNDNKETAEHHTIVDLIRNDLSMVATDVSVKQFRYIDLIRTNQEDILQVSSEIVGNLPLNYPEKIGTIIFKLLPAGSITGAPKRKTIEVIEMAEKYDRNFYSGICGYFDGLYLDSTVMIRFIEMKDDQMWFHSGGGITNNSIVELEYQELIDKIYVPIV
jgi:para-aminobenzoate synthetase component I